VTQEKPWKTFRKRNPPLRLCNEMSIPGPTKTQASDHVLFIQDRASRAGAQVSLSRIVSSDEIRAIHPFVLLRNDGWLNSFMKEQSIPHLIQPWPSPRSLAARLGGLKRFAHQTINQLKELGISPRAIVANDHQECLLALALSKASGNIPVAVILRSSGMSHKDFNKYQCNQCDTIFVRGAHHANLVKQWTGRDATCMLGSFTDADFSPPLPLNSSFPTQILIAGSEIPSKGFADFLQALLQIEQSEPDFPALDCTFTGNRPTDPHAEKLLAHPFRSQFHFKGRIDDFIPFAKNFQLAIHPSRSESFGMAPLELILAGVPTLVSTTGIIEKLNIPEAWQFQPQNPTELAVKITDLWKNWPQADPETSLIQSHIREHYHISQTAQQITDFVLL